MQVTLGALLAASFVNGVGDVLVVLRLVFVEDDVAIGIGTFIASAGVGAIWMAGGPSLAFGFSAFVAILAALLLMLRPLPQTMNPAR